MCVGRTHFYNDGSGKVISGCAAEKGVVLATYARSKPHANWNLRRLGLEMGKNCLTEVTSAIGSGRLVQADRLNLPSLSF